VPSTIVVETAYDESSDNDPQRQLQLQRQYDETLKWHRHFEAQMRDGYDSNAGNWKYRNGKAMFVSKRKRK